MRALVHCLDPTSHACLALALRSMCCWWCTVQYVVLVVHVVRYGKKVSHSPACVTRRVSIFAVALLLRCLWELIV
jgi:hypothetical protein